MFTQAESIHAGIEFLASSQAPNGGFQVIVRVGGPGFPSEALTSPFATAAVLDSLISLEEGFDVRSIVQRGVAYLLGEMEAGGSWRFYRCDPPLRPDLDSTSLTLRVLRRLGVALDYPGAARRILDQRDALGRVRTWFPDSASRLRRFLRHPLGFVRGAFNPVDPVVNANVLALLRVLGVAAPKVMVFVIEHAHQTPPGPTPYYLHPECFAHALSKAAEAGEGVDPIRVAAEAVVAQLIAIQAAGTAPVPPFLAARLLAAHGRLGRTSVMPETAAATLRAGQLPDGSWPAGDVWTAVRWAKGFPRPLLGSAAVETAIALEALNSCPT